MFATNQLIGMDAAFPDICKTPPAAIPIPYPNFAFTLMAIPVAVKILFQGAFAHNLATQIPLTIGDFPGVMTGLISNSIASASRRLILNSYTTLIFGTPANRMGCLGPQNRINMIGFTVIPSALKIKILAA